MGIDSASVGRKVRETCTEQKMVEELRKRLGESLKVKTGNCEEIRLTYFPARGRAEISRLILKHAGVKFDDIRLTGEDFAKVKPILPYGSMPVLEYKGEVLCESMAIAAFLADICNLAGTNAVEKAKANEIVLAMNGLFETIAKILFSPEGEKAGMKKKLLEETLPQKFGQLEARSSLAPRSLTPISCSLSFKITSDLPSSAVETSLRSSQRCAISSRGCPVFQTSRHGEAQDRLTQCSTTETTPRLILTLY